MPHRLVADLEFLGITPFVFVHRVAEQLVIHALCLAYKSIFCLFSSVPFSFGFDCRV